MGITSAIAAVASVAVSAYSGQKQASAQKKQAAQAKSASDRLYKQQDEQNNRMNARGPDIDALFAANELEGQQAGAGTMLTGPTGVDPNSLMLGKNTLLGGAAG